MQSVLLGLSGNGSEGFRSLWWLIWNNAEESQPPLSPYRPCLHPANHSCALLYCAVVLSHGKVLSCLHLVHLLQPKLVLFHSVLISIVLGYYQQFSSVFINSPWLAPQPSSHQYLRHTHHALIFWKLRVQKDLTLDHCPQDYKKMGFSHNYFSYWAQFELITFFEGSSTEILFHLSCYSGKKN